MRHRREQLRLTQADAARRAGRSRSAWIDWENDAKRPDADSRARIAAVLEWEPGSVDDVLAGGAPTPLRQPLATVTPLRPGVDAVPPDELEAELLAMDLPPGFVEPLIAKYRAEQAGLREQYRNEARRAQG